MARLSRNALVKDGVKYEPVSVKPRRIDGRMIGVVELVSVEERISLTALSLPAERL